MEMKKWIFFILVTVIFFTGCSKRDNSTDIKNEFMAKITEELEGGELINYIDGEIDLVSATPHLVKSMQFFEFVLEANLKPEFNDLSDDEKYDLFKDLDSAYLDSFCGEDSHCNIETFTFKNGEDHFAVSPSYGFSIKLNDEYFDPEPVRVTTNTTESSSDSGIDKRAVYNFMKLKYDEITNYGENYDPETHDQLVAQLAAAQFGISEVEAGEIYINIEMNGY